MATEPGKKLNPSSTLGKKKENHAIIFFEKNDSISTTKWFKVKTVIGIGGNCEN